MAQLILDKKTISLCRELAERITRPITAVIDAHSTVGIERATLRLLGLNSAVRRSEDQWYPVANAVTDVWLKSQNLAQGVVAPLIKLMLVENKDLATVSLGVANGELKLPTEEIDVSEIQSVGEKLFKTAVQELDRARNKRDDLRKEVSDRFDATGKGGPLLYVIVATGNIYDDVIQAKAAAQAGADAIAVIRSTAQSLLDYVPHGATTEGFGGTYATQENFRIMREALDEESRLLGRYIRLTNYCSGLCMAEIAALGSLERLDFLLNDAMYGILFRDINIKRTLIDQHFSRRILARSKMVIHTGEDNYLTTSDAVENGHQVLASQFINERFALNAKMTEDQLGLGHAQEMDPTTPNVFLLELARAQMTRDIFPNSPIKFMPPTRHKSGDVFYSHLMDAMFNFVGVTTQQTIQLLGMMTEAMHTPLLQDRYVAIKNAQYIFNGAKDLHSEFEYKPDGIINSWAKKVLLDTLQLLQNIEAQGLFKGIENRVFAEVSRTEKGGKGYAGVFSRAQNYYNPFFELL